MQFPQLDPAVFLAFAGFFGLAIGSFLNVVIHRLPIMLSREMSLAAKEHLAGEAEGALPEPPEEEDARYSLLWPPSACPSCRRWIRPLENIPLLGYFWLRGKCAGCGAAISVRYPLVEALTGLLFLAIAWQTGMSWATPLGWIFAALLIAQSAIDLDYKLLPDELVYLLLWSGLLASLTGFFAEPRDAILGAAVGYGVFYALRWFWLRAFRRDALGLGDAKLLAALGAWLGWQPLPTLLLLAALTGIAATLVLRLLRRDSASREIAFGPYLALSGGLHLFLGPQIASALAALVS